MATYVVGDVQGCHAELQALLEKVAFGSDDELWLVGDLINRGPASLETLRMVRQMGPQAKIVLGNHDLHFLAIYYGHHSPSRSDTFDELLAAPDVDELAHWLRSLPLAFYSSTHNTLMTHAGLPAQWTVKQAVRLADEVSQTLQDDHTFGEFFAQMYGNEACWQEDLFGMARLRCITNYLTRMRLVDRNGCLDFAYKGQLNDAPEDLVPWFSIPRQDSGKWAKTRFVFGHWAALDGRTGNARCIGVDTGAVWGRTLTSYCLEEETFAEVRALAASS